MAGKPRHQLTLLDVLIDGFEKNEILDGFHGRDLPMPDEASARRTFAAFVDEAKRWKGPPVHEREERGRHLAAWSDLEIRQAGRGILVRVRPPWFSNWWHDRATWEGDPMQAVHDALREEHEEASRTR
jgi:hypothetical protein